jgi:uncharacterized OB-fold protein
VRFDLPSPQAETQPFWDAARERRLLVMRSRATGRHFFYPRPFDPQTWSGDVEWVEASGRARLYTYSVVRQNDLPPWPERVPYVAAIVELEEGPKMMTQVVDCAFDALEIGMALEVDFRDLTDDVTIPVFRPPARTPP